MEKYSLYKGETYERNYERMMAELGEKSFCSRIKNNLIYGLNIRNKIAHVSRLCNQDMDTIEKAKDMKLLRDTIGRTLFQAYLMIGDKGASGETLKTLECYDECHFILQNVKEKFNEDYLEYFYGLAPDLGWESRAKHAFNYKNELKKDGKDMIIGLRNACIWSILIHYNFFRFKKDLKDKTRAIRKILIIMIKEESKHKSLICSEENIFKKLRYAEDKYSREGLYG